MKKFFRVFLFFCVFLSESALVLPLFSKDIVGAGSSFSYPLYKKFFYIYAKKKKKRVNYQVLGSGGGEMQLKRKIVSFCASENENNFAEDSISNDRAFVRIPSCVSPVVISYNLPNVPKIQLTCQVLADIYLGKISKWNDLRLKHLNPQVNLPSTNIIVVHRSDSSGTSAVFSKCLSQKSADWKKTVGEGLSLEWPVGIGANKNMGVASYVKQVPGSIGYLVYSFAASNALPMACIVGDLLDSKNNPISIDPRDFFRKKPLSLVSDALRKAPSKAYPLMGFTWLLTDKEQSVLGQTAQEARDLCDLFWWMTHEGQAFARELFYIPLSDDLRKEGERLILSITHNRQKVFSKSGS